MYLDLLDYRVRKNETGGDYGQAIEFFPGADTYEQKDDEDETLLRRIAFGSSDFSYHNNELLQKDSMPHLPAAADRYNQP